VLLTRPVHASAGLARRLEGLGAQVDLRPTIKLSRLEDPSAANAVLSRLAEFDWVLFTSRNGVEFFQELRSSHSSASTPPLPRAVAIGPDTAAAMQSAGIEVERIAEQPSSEGLVATMKPLLSKGDRVLWVRPESARPLLGQALSALGIELAECRCYRSIPDPDTAVVAADYLAGKYDVAVFASPSAFLHLLEADARIGAPSATRIVALGPVTAAAIARSGAQVAAVAQGTGEQAICGALLALFE